MSMSFSQRFLPADTLVDTGHSCIHNENSLDVIETRLNEYMNEFLPSLASQGFPLSVEETHSLKTASALIDALAKTRFDESDPDFPVLDPHHHAFNVFYQAPESQEWNLQFANSAYLAVLGKNLSDITQATETDLMPRLYTPRTMEKYNAVARYSEDGYRAQFIEMDNADLGEGEDTPAFFWYRKEFDHPNGGKIQVRIGMNGTGLSPEQQAELTRTYELTDMLRDQDLSSVYHSKYPCDLLMSRTQEKIDAILENGTDKERKLLMPLKWMNMVLAIADDIVKNSPFPLTIVGKQGAIEQISPAYAVMVGHTVDKILMPGFLWDIYRNMDKKILDQSEAYLAKNGRYPTGVLYEVFRGDDFCQVEEEMGIVMPRHTEIIPSPYLATDGCIVRLNSAVPSIKMDDYSSEHKSD